MRNTLKHLLRENVNANPYLIKERISKMSLEQMEEILWFELSNDPVVITIAELFNRADPESMVLFPVEVRNNISEKTTPGK